MQKSLQAIFLSIFSSVLLSLPWLNILPGCILFIGFVPLLILNDQFKQEESKKLHLLGYFFLTFWLWNLFVTWWISYVSVTGMLLIISLNASLMTLCWWLFHISSKRFSSNLSGISLLVFWIGLEYLQFNWQIEWPWLTLGNGFANQPKWIQWYEYTGVLGGSFWVLFINITLYNYLKASTEKPLRKTIFHLVIVISFIIIPLSISINRYQNYNEDGEEYNIAILQPNIDPYTEKFTTAPKMQLKNLLELTDSLINDHTDFLIGPETALHPLWESDSLEKHEYTQPFIERIKNHSNLKIILGATTKIKYESNDKLTETARKLEEINQYYDVFNTALFFEKSGHIQKYHKSKLVSGVEKMPFSKYLSFMEDLIVDLGGTTGNLGRQKEASNFLITQELQVAPVICFESIFGEYITDYIKKGASMIFIITNDGWWKSSSGAKQHFSFARLRAIETRRSIARSGNTGISAFINQRGDLIKQTKLGVKTGIKGEIKSNNKITFYTVYGDFIGRICSFIAVMLILFLLAQGKLNSQETNKS